jgi:hypothetical protein
VKPRVGWRKPAALGLLLVVMALTVITVHAISRGEREMTLSDAAFRHADLELALAHARRAAVLYAPGAPHVDAAFARLVAIAVGSEATGRPESAGPSSRHSTCGSHAQTYSGEQIAGWPL